MVQLSPWIKKTIWHIWQISPGIKKPFKPIWLLLLFFISGYNNEYKIKKNTNQNCSSLLNSCCYLLGYFSSITGKNCQCSHLYSWSVKLSSSKTFWHQSVLSSTKKKNILVMQTQVFPKQQNFIKVHVFFYISMKTTWHYLI